MGKNLSPKISSDKKELILDSFSIGTQTKYYGNNGCGIFKLGVQNQKDFCLRGGRCQKLGIIFENKVI
jgi:hypothetical protein